MSNLDELRKRIAYFIDPQIGEFEDGDLLKKATLIQKKTPAYRTYGLLGDAVLKVVVYEELLRESKLLLQGEMHKINESSELNEMLGEFGELKLGLIRTLSFFFMNFLIPPSFVIKDLTSFSIFPDEEILITLPLFIDIYLLVC